MSQYTVWLSLWRTLCAYRWIVLSAFLATLISSYVALEFVTEQYQISSTVLVKLGRENFGPPATAGNPNGLYTTTGVRLEEINSEIALLKSRELIESAVELIGVDAFKYKESPPPESFLQAVKYYAKKTYRWFKATFQDYCIQLGLKKRLSDWDAVILDLEERLSVEREKESDVISLTMKFPDPELGKQFLETLLRKYLDKHIEVHKESNLRRFMEGQADNYLDSLKQLDKQREQVRTEREISNVDEQKRLLLERLSTIQNDIDAYNGEYEILKRDTLSSISPAIKRESEEILSETGALRAVRDRVAHLQTELANLLEKYDEGADSVKDMRMQIARLEHLLMRSIKAHLAEQQASVRSLQKQIADLTYGQDRLEFIERERGVAKENYLLYIKKREEARISEELDVGRVSNVSVLSRPYSSLEPVSPKRLLIVSLSIPLGLIIGMAISLVIDYFRSPIRSQDDLADIPGLQYLGTFRVSAD